MSERARRGGIFSLGSPEIIVSSRLDWNFFPLDKGTHTQNDLTIVQQNYKNLPPIFPPRLRASCAITACGTRNFNLHKKKQKKNRNKSVNFFLLFFKGKRNAIVSRNNQKKKKNLKPTCFAGGTSPSRHAGLIAVAVAFVVAEHVVPRPAEFRARGVVVVGFALNPHAVSETQIAVDSRSFVSQRVPISARLQNARINGSFNFTWNFTKKKTKTKKKTNKNQIQIQNNKTRLHN